MRDYAVNLLLKLLEIYSPSGKEEEISKFLVNEMKQLGLHSWRDEVGNAFGEIGNGKPVVLLCGHMDTVPGCILVRLGGDRLYGRGASDAKGPLAAMVVATHLLLKEGFPGKIIVAGLIDEEGKGRGVKHLISKKVSADHVIFGEPSGVDNITIAYKGSLHLKITCETKTGHSSAPWLFENAIEKAFEVWNLIRGIHFSQERPESRFYSISFCMTGIKSGDDSSTVPSKCELHIDLRIPPPLTPEQVFVEIKKVLEEYQSGNKGVDVNMIIEDVCVPFEADKNSPLVRAISFAIRKVRNKPATLVRKTGTGDMNLFGDAMKVPVITYGPGDSHLDHTPDEWIDVKEYLDGVNVFYEALKRLYALTNPVTGGR